MDRDTVFSALALGWCTYTIYMFLVVLHNITWRWELKLQTISDNACRMVWKQFPEAFQEIISQWRWDWNWMESVFEIGGPDSTTTE